MSRFHKPETKVYNEVSKVAMTRALADAGVPYEEVKRAFIGYIFGDSCSGQRALYEIGMTGIPVINLTNNGATGATAVFMAARAVRGGTVDCALALGFEQM